MIESYIQFCSSRPRSGSRAAPYATSLAGGDPVPGASRCFISLLSRNSKLENIAPCYSSNKLCGPIQGEVKNKTSRNQNRYYEPHESILAGRPEVCPGGLVPIKIQKSKFKNHGGIAPARPSTTVDNRRSHFFTKNHPSCVGCNMVCYPIHSEGNECPSPSFADNSVPNQNSKIFPFVTQVTRFVDLYTVK